MKFPWYLVGITVLILLCGLLFLMVVVGNLPSRPDGPGVEIGTVFHVRGDVSVEGPDREGRRDVVPGMKLWNLDLLRSEGDGIAGVVVHPPGGPCGIYTVRRGERMFLWDLPEGCPLDPTFAEAIRKTAREWTEESEYPSPVEGQVEVLAPRGTVLERRPSFILRFPPGLETCRITLHAMMGMGAKEVAKFDAAPGKNLYPEDAMDLQPGVIPWLDVVVDGKETSHSFVVASETMAKKAAVFREEMARFDGDATSRAVATAAFLTESKLYMEALGALTEGGEEVEDIIDHLLADRMNLSRGGASDLREHLGLGP